MSHTPQLILALTDHHIKLATATTRDQATLLNVIPVNPSNLVTTRVSSPPAVARLIFQHECGCLQQPHSCPQDLRMAFGREEATPE